MARSVLLLIALLIQACAATPEGEPAQQSTGIRVKGMIIRNELNHGVTDVMIEVPATGSFAGCGNIMAKTSCSSSFPEVEYRANPLNLRWRERGVPQVLNEFMVEIPDTVRMGDETWVEVIIFAPGQAGVRLSRAD